MKTDTFKYICAACAVAGLTSCHNWLTEDTPGTTERSEYFTSLSTAENVTNAAYVPLMWEFSQSGGYYSEWFFGDIASDDALKGGESVANDLDGYDIDNFKTLNSNEKVLAYYRAQWQGISRANLALAEVPTTRIDETSDTETDTRQRLLGEAHFLRAYYYFRLVRMFGGMPLIEDVIDSSSKWAQTRTTRDATYQFILDDLKQAEELLWDKKKYAADDAGRATKGAAQAMLLKVNLYRADFLAQEGKTAEAQAAYAEAKTWGKTLIDSKQYSLDGQFFDNFMLAGENDGESLFEIQYVEDPTSDYGEGEGFTRGTFTMILQRARNSKYGDGWGFDRPTQNLFDEFEAGDSRRDATILTVSDEEMGNPSVELYCGNRYCNRKYAMYTETKGGNYYLTHHSRGPLNNKQIRYADVLLMYAEACVATGDLPQAQWALNQVRSRAGMNAFPYTAVIGGKQVSFANTADDLRQAIRHERRVELAMEGHRWFDLCRWGIAKETIDAYIATETAEAKAEFASFQKGKHELFPIPSKEIDLSGIEQNPGY